MPAIDDFFHLREYDSLLKQMHQTDQLVKEEHERLSRRESELANRIAQVKKTEDVIRELGHSFADIERRLTQHLKPEMAQQLEDQGLTIMQQQDEQQALLKDHLTFIEGFKKTVEEIKLETKTNIAAHEHQIQQLQLRLSLLKDQLPPDWAHSYQKVADKKLSHGCFTRHEAEACQFCRFKLSRPLQAEIETLSSLKTCPGCYRIFIPNKAIAG